MSAALFPQFGSLAVWQFGAVWRSSLDSQTANCFPFFLVFHGLVFQDLPVFQVKKRIGCPFTLCESPNHSPRPLAPFFGHCLTHRSGFAAGQPRRRVSSEARARHSSAQPRTWRRFRGTTHPRAEVPFLLVTTKCALFCWWPRASWRSSILPRADDRSTMIHLQHRRTLRC